ncbi:signal peptidase II [Marinospirillum alkaliphilum DSM 21637]|uniref:Lipoprotein signal peptidase n=2 Tax=Marinospirillum TaxID=64968 RepID=A0A1K1XZ95_9GAMM|nr:signal peptidase II [Marinospirillum alkaliphilum]SFX55089.1 signal peptidase II [Marinospirillum alkaliphilum DSM 21637]
MPDALREALHSLKLRRSSLPWLLLAGVLLALDLISKAWVSNSLFYGQRIEVLPVFDLVLLHNSGAAFSFLADAGGWQRWFFVLLAVVASLFIYGWLNRLQPGEKLTALALALILGGAIGNLHDRFFYGYVVDFLAFHWNQRYFPAFNIADAGITVGAVLLIWQSFFGQQPPADKA